MSITRKEFYIGAAVAVIGLAFFVSSYAAATFAVATWVVRTS